MTYIPIYATTMTAQLNSCRVTSCNLIDSLHQPVFCCLAGSSTPETWRYTCSDQIGQDNRNLLPNECNKAGKTQTITVIPNARDLDKAKHRSNNYHILLHSTYTSKMFLLLIQSVSDFIKSHDQRMPRS